MVGSVGSGLINFRKRQLEYKVIKKIKQNQSVPYNLVEVGEVRTLFDKVDELDPDKELYDLSKKWEPRRQE